MLSDYEDMIFKQLYSQLSNSDSDLHLLLEEIRKEDDRTPSYLRNVKELEDKSLLHMVVYGDEHEEIFNEVFKQLSGLRYGIVKSKTRSQTSIILFEAVSVGAALAYKSNKHINISKFYDWVNDKEFSNHITGATNSRKRVLARINYCRDKFLEK